MKLLRIIRAGALIFAGASNRAKPVEALQAIPALNVLKYLGRWCGLAKFSDRVQMKCASDTPADYSLLPDGSLRVLNQCRLQTGKAGWPACLAGWLRCRWGSQGCLRVCKGVWYPAVQYKARRKPHACAWVRSRGKGELLMVGYHKSSPALVPAAHWGLAAQRAK